MAGLRSHVVAVILILGAAPLAAAQTADPSGHWEGSMLLPSTELRFELDLARVANGELAGTIGTPAHHLIGLPLARVLVDGQTITFFAREDQPFTGVVSADGHSIAGKYRIEGQTIPLTLTRTGAAKIEPPPRVAAIPARLEGSWNATVRAGGREAHLVLTMVNQPDGSCTGSLVNVDEGRLRIPVTAVGQTASGVTIEFKPVSGSFIGTTNADASELSGPFTQGTLSVPVTFHRGTQ